MCVYSAVCLFACPQVTIHPSVHVLGYITMIRYFLKQNFSKFLHRHENAKKKKELSHAILKSGNITVTMRKCWPIRSTEAMTWHSLT